MTKKQGDRFESAIAKIHAAIEGRIERIGSGLRNEKPPGSRKVPVNEQLQNYLPNRDNPQMWQKLIQEHGIKGALKYYRSMEGLAKRKFDSIKKDMGLPDDLKYRRLPLPQPIVDALVQTAGEYVGGNQGFGQEPPPPEQMPPGQQLPPDQGPPMMGGGEMPYGPPGNPPPPDASMGG